MAHTYPIHPSAVDAATEHRVVHRTHTTLKYLFGLLAIVAGADKFTNFICNWEMYLNPMILQIVPMSAHNFMLLVGGIEIVAGIIVFIKPRLGGIIVGAWLLGIALELILWGRHLDVAVRDIAMAIGGCLTLVRLSPLVEEHRHG